MDGRQRKNLHWRVSLTEQTPKGEFDFGFSSEEELPLEDTRAQQMYEAVLPLLENLMKDADKKPVINWPNRGEKIAEFKEKLLGILNS